MWICLVMAKIGGSIMAKPWSFPARIALFFHGAIRQATLIFGMILESVTLLFCETVDLAEIGLWKVVRGVTSLCFPSCLAVAFLGRWCGTILVVRLVAGWCIGMICECIAGVAQSDFICVGLEWSW